MEKDMKGKMPMDKGKSGIPSRGDWVKKDKKPAKRGRIAARLEEMEGLRGSKTSAVGGR